MRITVKFIRHLLLSLLLLCYILSVDTVQVINYRQRELVNRAKRQVSVPALQFQRQQQQQQQYIQPQRNNYGQQTTQITSKQSIFAPRIRFLTATPQTQQQHVFMPQQKYQIQSQVGQPLQQNTPYQMQQQSTRTNLFQYSQTTSPPNKADIGQLFSPLLPSYLDEDDLSYNFTRTCDLCCIRGQTPCENCCDSNPLISGAALKSAAG